MAKKNSFRVGWIAKKRIYLWKICVEGAESAFRWDEERTGEMLEWLKRHAWKACKRQKRFRGSNPRLSADLLN